MQGSFYLRKIYKNSIKIIILLFQLKIFGQLSIPPINLNSLRFYESYRCKIWKKYFSVTANLPKGLDGIEDKQRVCIQNFQAHILKHILN